MPYECAECYKTFTTMQGLSSHCMAKQHYRRGPGRIINYCYQCDRHFVDKIALEQHLQHSQAHQIYSCSVCNRSFDSEWSLDQHDETYCHHCERQFRNEDARKRHYQNAAVHRNSYCSECEWLFDDEDEKDSHDETYHERFYHRKEKEDMFNNTYWHGYRKLDEELARQIAIEESRRKLAQLEADKLLWEAAAKQRLTREEAERGSIRVKATTLSPAEEEREEAERKLREAEERRKEDERRQREAAAQRERQQQKQRWAYGPWTTERTLERYKVMSEEFDSAKFSAELPLITEAVPWPVLTPPARLNITEVNWDAVEKFFTAVKTFIKPQEYKAFIEKGHRRFHPDRWQSRNLWKAVVDETERENMKAAVNTVSQALTPIWSVVIGR